MHKDLSENSRALVEGFVEGIVESVFERGESLGIAREAMIAAFDRKAKELDNA